MTVQKDLPDITPGDTKEYTFTFEDGGGTAYDLTGWTLYFTVKEAASDADSDAIISKDITTHSNPTAGESTITLSASETDIASGVYSYDVQVKTDTGRVTTVMKGVVHVSDQVTFRS